MMLSVLIRRLQRDLAEHGDLAVEVVDTTETLEPLALTSPATAVLTRQDSGRVTLLITDDATVMALREKAECES